MRLVLSAAVLSFALNLPGAHTNAIVSLTNGDRITGRIVSESSTNLILHTDWSPKVEIPRSRISDTERLAPPIVVQPKPKPKPPPKPAPKPKPAATKLAKAKSTAPKAAKPKPKIKGKWAHDLRLGLDQRFSIVDQQTFHTRLKSRYSRGNFKANSDFSYSYGETEALTTADRFKGLLKTDVTINGDLYLYGNGSSSYDIVRRIKQRWEAGAGAGYRALKNHEFLIKGSKMSIDLETGAEYQEQKSTRNVSSQNYLWRLGQGINWDLTKNLKFSEEIDFFPQIGELPSHRYRAEGNIAYRLLKSLSLNFTVLAEAYPETLQDIEPDDLQLRSSLGWTF